jgi:hypothetical protein
MAESDDNTLSTLVSASMRCRNLAKLSASYLHMRSLKKDLKGKMLTYAAHFLKDASKSSSRYLQPP